MAVGASYPRSIRENRAKSGSVTASDFLRLFSAQPEHVNFLRHSCNVGSKTITYLHYKLLRYRRSQTLYQIPIMRKLKTVIALSISALLCFCVGSIGIGDARSIKLAASATPNLDHPPLPIPASSLSNKVVAFVGVNLISMEKEGVERDQTVVVRDGRISEAGPATKIKLPRGALHIDGRGKFLMPGLIDMHVHEFSDDRQMLLFVANGVTTVRNMAGKPRHLELKRLIQTRDVLAPSFYTCGPLLLGFKDPKVAVQQVDRTCDAGYDCVKIYNTLDWSLEAYDAAIDEAVRRGVPPVGHLPEKLPIESTVRRGRQTIEHTEQFLYAYFFKQHPLDPSTISYAVKLVKDAGIAIDPTLLVYHTIALIAADDAFKELKERPELQLISPDVRSRWINDHQYRDRFSAKDVPALDRNLDLLRRLTKAFADAGVPLLLGTDTAEDQPFIFPGFSLHEELAELVKAGLTPCQALRAGTVNAAAVLGGASEFGSIRPGMRADMILLDGNPLEDIASTKRRTGVMLRGHWLPEALLKAQEADLRASYSGSSKN